MPALEGLHAGTPACMRCRRRGGQGRAAACVGVLTPVRGAHQVFDAFPLRHRLLWSGRPCAARCHICAQPRASGRDPALDRGVGALHQVLHWAPARPTAPRRRAAEPRRGGRAACCRQSPTLCAAAATRAGGGGAAQPQHRRGAAALPDCSHASGGDCRAARASRAAAVAAASWIPGMPPLPALQAMDLSEQLSRANMGAATCASIRDTAIPLVLRFTSTGLVEFWLVSGLLAVAATPVVGLSTGGEQTPTPMHPVFSTTGHHGCVWLRDQGEKGGRRRQLGSPLRG